MKRKRGQTLIELLVVIATLAVLAAILFPVFHMAREKARINAGLDPVTAQPVEQWKADPLLPDEVVGFAELTQHRYMFVTRIKVDGGWLYYSYEVTKYNFRCNNDFTTTFVPDSESELAERLFQ